jgi:hypothetical protein
MAQAPPDKKQGRSPLVVKTSTRVGAASKK